MNDFLKDYAKLECQKASKVYVSFVPHLGRRLDFVERPPPHKPSNLLHLNREATAGV